MVMFLLEVCDDLEKLSVIVTVRKYLNSRAGWIFLHGTREKNQESLREENAAFGDILQGDFPDTYPFLSYKVIMSFIWINK